MMMQNFRQSMTWVHTWFGLVLGFVLMVTFFFGALSVFDREFDRWTIPASRFEPQPMPSFDRILRPVFEKMQPTPRDVDAMRNRVNGAMPEHFDVIQYWSAYTTHRDPVLSLYTAYKVPNAKDPDDLIYANAMIDPRSGAPFPQDRLAIGSGFFYPLHYGLTLNWMGIGYWIVGFAALVMLVALITGIVMHRRIFREFFTFRPGKTTQRSILDLHNLTGVVALPFHFFFAFTGLLIFAGIYFPVGHTQLKPLHDLHEKIEARDTGLPHERAGVPGSLASVDAMVAQAQRRWLENGLSGEVGALSITHMGDANAYVSVYRAGTDRIALTSNGVHFKASSGELLYEDPAVSPVGRVSEFLVGLHLQHFRHWLLRWLYAMGGLTGCVCIATGFLFFVEKRKQRHGQQHSRTVRIVDAMAVTVVSGMPIAMLGILIANRLLPDTIPEGLPGRGDLERYAFWCAWAFAMAHAFWRTTPAAFGRGPSRLTPAWHEQCWMIAGLAVMAVLLNWVTTGDHLARTLAEGYWPVAGIDSALLAGAGVALMTGRKLKVRSETHGRVSTAVAAHG